MPLQQIRPDFSGSAQSMHQAMQGVNQLGDYANQLIKDVRQKEQDAKEQARYDTELARQKVLDDRATTLYDQQQKERADLLAMKTAVGQGLLGIPEDALTMGQQGQPITQGGRVSPQEAYMSQGRSVVVPGTQGYYKTEQSPGKYSNPNPTIVFNRGQTVSKENKLPENSKLSQVIDGMAPLSGIGNIAKGVNAFLPDAAKNKLLETPGMYTSIPGSSARVLNAAGKEALLKGSYTTTERKVAPATTTLNDIDLTKVYNAQGKPLSAKDAGDGSKVYYGTKAGDALVNAMDVYKGAEAKEKSYVKGKSEKTYVPGSQGYTKYVSGTTNKEFIGSNGTTVPVKTVVGSVQESMNSYQDVINKMTEGTTAKRLTKLSNDITMDVLKAHPELAHMAIDIQEMAKKGVGLKLPDGSLTKTEEMKLVAAGEDLKQLHSVQKEQRGYDQARWLQNDSQGFQAGQNELNRAAARENTLLAATNKESNKTIPMFKKLATGETHRIDVPLANAKAYEGAGFTMGTVGGSKNPVPAAGAAGKSAVDLLELGGNANIGGTSGIDLVTLASRMKAKYPRVPKSAIETEVAQLSQGWVSDAVDLDKLEANLKGYSK